MEGSRVIPNFHQGWSLWEDLIKNQRQWRRKEWEKAKNQKREANPERNNKITSRNFSLLDQCNSKIKAWMEPNLKATSFLLTPKMVMLKSFRAPPWWRRSKIKEELNKRIIYLLRKKKSKIQREISKSYLW